MSVISGVDLSQYAEHVGAGQQWNLPLDHWSPSSLAMLHRCPRQWQCRYLHNRKEKPGEALSLGTAVHVAIERNFRQKIDTHEDLPVVDLADWYQEVGFPQTVTEAETKAETEIVWDTSAEAARKRGLSMLSEYHVGVAPRVQPLSVEGEISVDLDAFVPVIGRFDVDREQSVIDVKTGKSSVSKPKEAWRIQAAVYGEAREKPVEFHHVAATLKTNKVTVTTPLESEAMLVHPTTSERAELRRTIRSLASWAVFLMDAYGPDEAWPTWGRFHGWACDYCGYRSDCPAWQDL